MKKLNYFGLILISVIEVGCSASKYHRANYEYSNMSYFSASKKYAASLKHKNRPLAVARLADCYQKMHDLEKAEYWYARAVAAPNALPEHKLAYARVLKENGKYEVAKEWFGKYLEAKPTDKVAMAQMMSCDSVGAYTANAVSYRVDLLNIPNNVNSFGITPFEGGFAYCAEQAVAADDKNNKWDGRPYMHMLCVKKLDNGQFSDPTSLSETLNNPYHNGPLVFNSAFDKVYFSSSNNNANKLVKNADKINNIKLYTACKKGGQWTDIKALPFNNDNYSCGQPALSPSGDTLFFISDRPGGKGGTDIYMSINQNGTWSAPQNLGENINTSGAEMFPTFSHGQDGHNYLYFSTDGLPGMGGLDLFRSELLADGTWDVPVHLDAPLNSSKDDFGILFTNAKNTTGYLSSSRDEDKDKLFAFSKITDIYARGAVYNKKTNEPIIATTVEVYNHTTGQKDLIHTDNTGRFSMPLAVNTNYTFGASKEHFTNGQSVASTYGEKGGQTIEVRIDLEAIVPPPPPTPDAMANLYFDLDKSAIREDARAPLDLVVDKMLKDQEMVLEIDAHADSRGTDDYNMELSRKRVMSVLDYMIRAGIPKERLKTRWYGKSLPVNECLDGIACPPEKHQENRRVEFKQVNNKNLTGYVSDRH